MDNRNERLIRRVLSDRIKRFLPLILFYAGSIGLFRWVSYLYQEKTEPFLYAAVLLGVCLLGAFVISVILEYRKALHRKRVLRTIGSEWRELPSPSSLEAEDLQEMIAVIGRDMEDVRARRAREQQELVDYYTTWVHQIKTPMSVMRLLLKAEDSDANRALETELFRIEQYVEMALNYTRLESESKDLVIKSLDLDELIRQTIRKYASQFIAGKVRLIYEPAQGSILTDKKWFSCILEQLLSNAVKYTPAGGSVTIRQEGERRLVIRDTGIGIAAEDLPRIFEKGFTGINGRCDKRATGLGLYLCSKAAKVLGIRIAAESTQGKGSVFSLEWEDGCS